MTKIEDSITNGLSSALATINSTRERTDQLELNLTDDERRLIYSEIVYYINSSYKKPIVNAKELLELRLDGHSTLKDIFDTYNDEGGFGTYVDKDGLCYSLGTKEGFYEELAQRVIDCF